MGYPYGKTYLEQIQDRVNECEDIEKVFYVLRQKYIKEHPVYTDVEELSLSEHFALLGEAFEYSSTVLEGVSDKYHFMWDVVDALLLDWPTREKKKAEKKQNAN